LPFHSQSYCLPNIQLRRLSSSSFPVDLLTTTLHISGLNTEPAFLIHLASNSRYRVCSQASLLTCWLGFSQVGLVSFPILTHWVAIINFFSFDEIPKISDLSWHNERIVSYGLVRNLGVASNFGHHG
jgi:hypothetical protein